jgi:hypothetical protein
VALFALDQNFPQPILAALDDFLPEAELVPLGEINALMAEIEDWEVLLALHHHARPWDGLITMDKAMLNCRSTAISDKPNARCCRGREQRSDQGDGPAPDPPLLYQPGDQP